MNKKLLLVLLISALMLFCFAWVYARHADETKGTTTSERPSDEVLKELKELGKRIKPEMEAVPEVKLEDMPSLPHVGEVRRPSEQDYQRMLQTKGLAPVDPVKTMDNLKGSAVPVPAGVVDERGFLECLVYVHDPATCCYYHPDGEEGLWGWGGIQMKTWNDPQQNPEQSACGYPIYPFAVKGVEVQIYTVGPCKIFASFDIEDFVWDHCSPYPGPVLYESEIIEFDLPGGWAFIGVEFEDSICVYDRFFASWTFYNDMDFYPYGEEPPCWGDPVDYAPDCIKSIDTTWGHWECVEPADPVDPCIVRIDTITGIFDYELGLQPPPPPISSVQWHQIWPPAWYCSNWHQDAWEDNGDGLLSECDYLYMSLKPDFVIQKKYHIENVTRTLKLTLKPDLVDIYYLDLVEPSPDAPWDTLYWEPIFYPISSLWHVIWPPEEHCDTLHLTSWEDNGNQYLDSCDQIDFTDEATGEVRWFHVEKLSTNITVTYIDTVWGHWECVEPADPVDPCVVSVDTTWGHIAPFDFMPSLVFDLSGWCEHTYWSFAYYWTIGVFWDAVCDLPAFGFGWPGACRIRAWGKVADQNDCPDSTLWWQKEAFPEYAPCGMPDFDQTPRGPMNPAIGPWDGPAALANCLWWMASAGMLDPFWDDSDGDGDNWDPDEVPNLINILAGYMGLGNCGVTPAQMDSGLAALKTALILWFTHEEIDAPTWEEIEYNTRISQDVLLLLGFWYIEDISGEPPETTWARIGGHWVTVAGVDAIHGLLKISDPCLDMAELGWPGEACSAGVYIPHDHVADPFCHDDAGNVSHDIYPVMPSITPCGVLDLVEYPYYELDLEKYLGHNLPYPGCVFVQPPVVPAPLPPIYVEIECAKVICPEEPYKCETIWGYAGDLWVGMTHCNYGRLGNRDENGFWWDGYGNALFDGSIIVGNDKDNLAFFGGDNDPPGEIYPEVPITEEVRYKQKFYNEGTGTQDSLEYVYQYSTAIHNQPRGVGLPLNISLAKFVVHIPWPWDIRFVINIYDFHSKIDSLWIKFAEWKDWDLLDNLELDKTGAYPEVGWGWQYNPAYENAFGTAMLPPGTAERFAGLDNTVYVHPNAGWGLDRDSLWNLMDGADWNTWDTTQGPQDMSTLLTSIWIHLDSCETFYLITIKFDCGTFELRKGVLFNALKMIGYYRGDANCDGYLDLSDVIYTANYKFGIGPQPKPFEDQADVNRDGIVDLSDVIYLAKYKFGVGPPPTDYSRFDEIPFPDATTMFEMAGYKDLGKP